MNSFGKTMFDEQHRHAVIVVQLVQRFEHAAAVRHIQRGGGFVQHQDLWAHGQGGGNGHELLLSARKLGGALGPQVGNSHRVQRPGDSLRHLPLGQPQITRAKRHLLANAEMEKLRGGVLKDERDLLRQFGQGMRQRVQVIDLHAAGHASGQGVWDDAGQRPGQGALATA